jgi:outer membrane protein assembly factor BamE
MRIPTLIVVIAAAALSACSSEGGYKIPGVYRIDVQQGNVITQEMLDTLKPGMDRNQVRFVMGTPAVEDPFHAERWDYLYSMSRGGGRREQRHVSLFFRDDRLSHIDGDVKVNENLVRDELKPRAAPVEVRLEDNKPGFFSRMFNALPFVGDDETEPAAEQAEQPAQQADEAEAAETTARAEPGLEPDAPEDSADASGTGMDKEAETADDAELSDEDELVDEALPDDEVSPAIGVGTGGTLSDEEARRRAVFGEDPEFEPLPEPSDQNLPSEEM